MDSTKPNDAPNVIPLRDVTEQESRAATLKESVAKVTEHILTEQPFVFAAIGKGEAGGPSVHIHCGADTHQEFLGCLMGLVTTLGMAELGDGAQSMPPEILQAVAMSTGMKRLNETAREAFHAMGVERADKPDNTTP